MNIIEVPRTILRFQYQIARLPLRVIEDRVVSRLDEEAPARLLYERTIGALDATVGNALGEPELQNQGAALAARSEARGRAAALEATAAEKKQQADQQLKAARDEAVEDRKEARAAAAAKIDGARETAAERKTAATVAAGKRATAAKKQADDVAARRKETVEAAKRQELGVC